MPFKMPEKTKQTYNGLAVVTKAKKGEQKYWKVVMTITDGDQQKEIEAFVKPDKAPSYLDSGRWRIRLSQDKQHIFSAIPSDAVVKAEFKDIWHRENEDPAPLTRQGKYGPYLVFSVIWEVVEGDFKGVEIIQELSYNFEPSDWGGKTVAGYTSTKKRSDRTAMLDAVLQTLGVLGVGDEEKPLPWKDNLLPTIKKRAISAREEHGVQALLTISSGWVIAVKAADTHSGDWDEEGDYSPKQEPKSEPVEETKSEDNDATEDGNGEIPWDTEE